MRIKAYKEAFAEIIAKINGEFPTQINVKPVFSASEAEFCKKLAGQDGTQLGGSYPSADTDSADEDCIELKYDCLLFLLKKLDLSMMSDEELDDFYDTINDLMQRIMQLIASNDFGCDKDIRFAGTFRFEWEFNYSGFYGASISFNLK